MSWNRIIIGIFVLTIGCRADDAGPGASACEPTTAGPEPLSWKRLHALSHDLMGALELEDDALCTELGRTPCVELYRLSLGASEPFENTIYEPAAAPSVLSPLVTDRLVLAACHSRVARDAAAPGDARVFTSIDLTASSVEPADAGEQVQALYRRILRREASDDEVEIVAALAARDDVSADSFATLACFSIATTSEFLLF